MDNTMKKHIALYLAALPYGGTERVVINLAKYLYEQGYKVTIVTTYKLDNEMPLPDGVDRIVTEPSDMVFDQGRVGNFKKRIRNLKSVWNGLNPDVIVSFIGKNNMMALLTTRRLHIPVYVAVRGAPEAEYYNKLLRLVSKTLFVLSDGIILQTKQSVSYFPFFLRKKCRVLRNPLNPLFLEDNIDRIPDKRIVSVGRIDENKNQKMLINAFYEIAQDYPEWTVEIFGDGPLREELTEYVKYLGLESRVFLPGNTDNTRASISNAGLFVMTSNTEGMPNALIEAMTLGLPVISTDCPCGGPAELIENGKNGMLVPAGNADELKVAIKFIISNSMIAEKMSKEAQNIKQLLDPKVVNKEWEDYLLGRM